MLHLAEALAWHSTHSLALLNCHDLPQGEDYVSHKPGGKREYGESHHCCRLCLSFRGRLMIHYSWLSVCVEPGLLLPFKSKLNIHSPRLEAAALLVSSSLLTQFPNLRVCVFRLRLFIQSDETGRPDGHWIIMSFIFKCTALSSQWPNQFKRFPKLHPTHRASHPRPQDVQEQSCTVFTSIFKNMLKTLACPNPDDHFFFFFGLTCRSLSRLQKPYTCPAGPSHLQPNQFVSSPNNGACVWQRWMRAQGSS